MADTGSPFSLRYQTLADAPDGAGLGQNLATDTASWLSRAYPVANASARTALSVSEGFICRQRDDGSVWMYTDLATWAQINVGGGAGSSVIGVLVGQWRATTVQTFTTSGTEYPLALGVEDTALSGVTRSSKGVGNKFTCTAGTYLASANVRFDTGGAGSRFIGIRTADDASQYWSAQADEGSGVQTTRQVSGPIVLGSTTDIYVVISQSSGGSLSTKPTSPSQNPSGYVKFTLARVG